MIKHEQIIILFCKLIFTTDEFFVVKSVNHILWQFLVYLGCFT